MPMDLYFQYFVDLDQSVPFSHPFSFPTSLELQKSTKVKPSTGSLMFGYGSPSASKLLVLIVRSFRVVS